MRFGWDPVQISKNIKKYLKMNMNTSKQLENLKLWCGGTNMRCGWDPVQIFAAPVDTSSLLSHCTVGTDQEAISKICK